MRILAEFVDGALCRPNDRELLATHNPASGELIGHAPIAHHERVRQALMSARTAFDTGCWSRQPPAFRAELLRDLADLMEENLDSLAEAETADTGMLLSMTKYGHLQRAIAHLRYFAGEAERLTGECFSTNDAYMQFVEREPLGVIAIFSPWNAPLAVATINLAAALAVGNTVVLKSSERAPFSLSLLAELVAHNGFPAGVLNIVHGPADPTGQSIVDSKLVDGLCFVGGTESARAILRKDSHPFRRNTFELGGKSPTIICGDANLELAVDGALLSAFGSNGEVCTAGSRILVDQAIHDTFLQRFVERASAIRVGDPRAAATELGPLIDKRHLDAVQEHLRLAQHEGARLECGGERPANLEVGYYVRPAVLSAVTPDMAIYKQEVFGPVASIVPVDNAEHAIALANDSEFGLAASVWCGESSDALVLARRLRCGVVAVNSPVIRDIRVAFGGWRSSGTGRVGGHWSIQQFTECRTTSIPLTGYALPRLGSL